MVLNFGINFYINSFFAKEIIITQSVVKLKYLLMTTKNMYLHKNKLKFLMPFQSESPIIFKFLNRISTHK